MASFYIGRSYIWFGGIIRMTENERMRQASGEVDSDSRLVCFLYLLARNAMPIGQIESLIDEISNNTKSFTNGWLAEWAKDAEHRLND